MEIDFLQARHRLYNSYQTLSGISGHDCPGAFFELYRDTFLDALDKHGYLSDIDLAKILEIQNECEYVGDFLSEPKEQICELAAFGLILFDRIALIGWGQLDPERCFMLHEQLFECYEYVRDSDKQTQRAREFATARYKLNAEVRAFVVAEWKAHAGDYDNNKSEFARHYVNLIRQNYTDRSGDPFRVTEKTIREVWLSDAPSAGSKAL